MEEDPSANALKQRSRRSTRLHKDPPTNPAAVTFNSSVARPMGHDRSPASPQRHPSAPGYSPRSYAVKTTRDHHHSKSSAYNSSNTSLDRQTPGPSPAMTSPQLAAQTAAYPIAQGPARQSVTEKGSSELLGAPSDAPAILNTADPTMATGYQNSLRRPGPPPLSHTSPDPRLISAGLRQSASFSMGDLTMEIQSPSRAESGMMSPKRYSDDGNSRRSSAALRKKSGFTSFVNNMLGSPRNVKISAPENPVHVMHVGVDTETGQLTVGLLES